MILSCEIDMTFVLLTLTLHNIHLLPKYAPPYLLSQCLLQGGQSSVCVGGVSLEGFYSLLQTAQLLLLVPQLLLKVLDLGRKRNT